MKNLSECRLCLLVATMSISPIKLLSQLCYEVRPPMFVDTFLDDKHTMPPF